MNFNSYIVSDTKTALSFGVTAPSNTKSKSKSPFKFAFTLAETLITLTIIGVIAALTIPTLYSNYQKHTYVVALKKAYATLQNAVKLAFLDAGCEQGDFSCLTNNISIKSQIKGKQSNSEEIYKDRTSFPGAIPDDLWLADDGIIYAFTGASIGVDINGGKGPNKAGRDQFFFDLASTNSSSIGDIIEPGTVLPWGSMQYARYKANLNNSGSNFIEPDETSQYYWKIGCTSYGMAYCTGRVLEEDAMNY